MSVPWMYCEETVGSVRAELAKLRIQTLGVHVYTQWVHVHLYPKKSLIFEEICFTSISLTIILFLKGMQTQAGVRKNSRGIQMLSAAEMYLNRKFLISEMCMVSLMVVSLLRTWRRPLSNVFSPMMMVKRTPISSYLHYIHTETHRHEFKER